MCGPSICKKPYLKWWPFLQGSTTVPCCKSTDPCFNPVVLGTLFDPCRLAYLTYTSNDCVRPHLTMNFPT